MAFMTLEKIGVSYDKKKQILKGLDLAVEKGELVSLLGPSGCGKTTTLRVVAGFIEPGEGTFTLDGNDMTTVPVHKRNFGIVFQSYALFPHLTVYDNVAFGLRTRKMDKSQIDKKVKDILEICGLTELSSRFPKEMSGGQRQRVALARALVIEPKLLLLDEPLSNLDAKLRISMRVEIKRLQKKLGITTLFVTHDQEECFSISDKVAVMNGGVIGIDDLFRDGYKAIFVGTGVWKPNALHIKGETLGHVHFGINYLNNPDSYELGDRVIVIGAGNAAMDVARTAIRKGVRQLTCFSITKKVAASHHEFSYAQLEGVRFEYNKAPVEITDEGVIFKDVIEDENGHFTDVSGSQQLYPADSVIISISQGPQNRIVNTTQGLAADARGLLVADETGHTTRPGIFASGDVVNGARTVVEAVAHSKIVAESMHQYMQSLASTEEAAKQ